MPASSSQATARTDHTAPAVNRRRTAGERQRPRISDRSMWEDVDKPGTYLPSPEAIAAECAAIQATWTPEERLARAAGNTGKCAHSEAPTQPAAAPVTEPTPEPQTPLYGDSEPRTIWFPTGFLQRIEKRPGALIEVLTLALSAYLAQQGGVQ